MEHPITVYGELNSEQTRQARATLDRHAVAYQFVDIDHDAQAEQFVLLMNQGQRVTPTIVLGPPDSWTILSAPDEAQLDEALARLGYLDRDAAAR